MKQVLVLTALSSFIIISNSTPTIAGPIACQVVPSQVNTTTPGASDPQKLQQITDELLKNYNNDKSSVKITVNQLVTTDKKMVSLELSGTMSRHGKKADAEVSISKFDYEFADTPCATPEITVEARGKFDLVKAYGQAGFNQFGRAVGQYVMSSIQYKMKYLEDALTVKKTVNADPADEKQDLKSVNFTVTADVDLTSLPDGVNPEDVPIVGATISGTLTATALSLSVKFQGNPASAQYEPKPYLDKLLTGDKATMDLVAAKIKMVDDLVTTLTGGVN